MLDPHALERASVADLTAKCDACLDLERQERQEGPGLAHRDDARYELLERWLVLLGALDEDGHTFG